MWSRGNFDGVLDIFVALDADVVVATGLYLDIFVVLGSTVVLIEVRLSAFNLKNGPYLQAGCPSRVGSPGGKTSHGS